MAEARGSLLRWRTALALVALTGAIFIVVRFVFGIGAIANINNAYPWGWWVGFGVLSFIAFGGCGFTLALLVDIVGLHRYAPLVRPAITMGLLLYLGYVVILMVELGRPWMGWLIFLSCSLPRRSSRWRGAPRSTPPSCSSSSGRWPPSTTAGSGRRASSPSSTCRPSSSG